MFVRFYHGRTLARAVTVIVSSGYLFFAIGSFIADLQSPSNHLHTGPWNYSKVHTTGVTDNPTTEEQSSKPPTWHEQQQHRRRILADGCHGDDLTLQQLLQRKKSSDYDFPDITIVDETHRLVYCAVPKVATTNWKRVFLILGGKSGPTMRDLVEFNPHDMNYYKTLRSYPLEKQLDIIQNYRKFLFVRHPHNRLVSSYYDRLRYDPTVVLDENFQQLIGTYIIDHYRPKNETTVDSLKRGHDVRFPELVDYLSDETNPYRLSNGHFAPINDLCYPCQVNYTHIGKYETLIQDADMILRQVNVTLPFIFPPSTNAQSQTSSRTSNDLRLLSTKQMATLNGIYERDFRLFGYDAQQWVIKS